MSLEQYKDASRAELWDILQIQMQVLQAEVAKNAELEKGRDEAVILAEQRRQFIVNGEDLGYISVPTSENDQAYYTFMQCGLDNSYALEAHNLEQVDKFILFCKNASSLTGLDKLQIHSLGILYSQQAKTLKDGDV